jgi:hypothetical protein
MKPSGTTQHRSGRGMRRAASLVLALLFVSLFLTPVFAQYKRTDLVSNQPGVAPTTDEQHLVNPWSTPGGSLHFPAVRSGSATTAPGFPLSTVELVSKFHSS